MYQSRLSIDLADARLVGDLLLPDEAGGLVVFVHGSGSSRLSPRNREVASYLGELGLATLLFDLLTEAEERIDRITCELRFNIPMLTRRLVEVIDWLAARPELKHLPIGLFGASTGAAAAILATVQRPQRVNALVSRGGRTDLVGSELRRLHAPLLQIVGARDPTTLDIRKSLYLSPSDRAFERRSGFLYTASMSRESPPPLVVPTEILMQYGSLLGDEERR